MTDKIPQGHHTITPSLAVDGAEKAIALYEKALGAKTDAVLKCPRTGKVMHASLTLGTSKLMVADLFPEMGCGEATKSTFYLYFEDVEAAFKKAVSGGMTEKMAPTDMFWGDRLGAVTDPFGNTWTLATHVRDVSKDDIEKGAKEWGKAA